MSPGHHEHDVTPRPHPYATRRLADELPAILSERQISLRILASKLGLDHSFLSRAVRGADGKVLTPDLVRRIADELALPPEHFVEVREALVIERIRADGELRDRLYDDLIP